MSAAVGKTITRRVPSVLAVVAMALFGALVSTTPAVAAVPVTQPRVASTVSADPLPTVQIDSGVVYSTAIVGNTVYAAGNFANARPAGAAPGTNLIPRNNLLAFNLVTGEIVQTFAPNINGQVNVVRASPDGSRIYIGGTFNNVDGQTRWNMAAFNTATGALVPDFKAAVGGSYVNAIAVTNSAVYVGGLIGAGNGVLRQHLVAFNTQGQLLGWAPTTDLQVDAMVLTPSSDKLIVGGRFAQVNGVPQRGLVALDLNNGAILPWEAPNVIKNGRNDGSSLSGRAGIYSLSADSNTIYGTGWVYANAVTGNLEGTFAAEPGSGNIKWIADCHGDTYGAHSDGENVYIINHNHDCQTAGGMVQGYPAPGNLRHSQALTADVQGELGYSPFVNNIYADWSGWPGPAMRNWFPDWTTGSFTGQGQAGWSVNGSGDYVVIGGEFPFVNGQRQQGIVRFARSSIAPNAEGPRQSGTNWAGMSVRSIEPGTVRISTSENWDRDNLSLTYELRRSGTPGAIATLTQDSTYWNRGPVNFTDTGLPPGSTQTYRVVARDSDGNEANSNWVDVMVAGATSPYPREVLNDGATLYWRMGSSSDAGSAWVAGNGGLPGSGMSSTGGAIAGDPSPATTFSGSSGSYMASERAVYAGNSYAMEFWLKTTTNRGGKLMGYHIYQSGLGGAKYDRHVYMLNNGRLRFGTFAGTIHTITSGSSYNDGQWHHIVASQGSGGMKLYVDGALVASNTLEDSDNYTGYWMVGGGRLVSWPDRPTSDWIAGSIDEAAVYPAPLSAAQITSHFQAGQGNTSPAASFTATPNNLTVAFDATASQAFNGATITGYSWTYGDGQTGSGATPSHTYSQPGDYTVTLTVTDSAGRTGQTSQTVTVANAPKPVAVIDSAISGLSVAFDGTGSTAPTGQSIAGYQWTFGDSGSSTQAQPTHQYASGGTYEVSLVVTDSAGGVSDPATTSVTVSHAAPVAALTTSVDGLSVNVDGTGSTASDGATLTYDWDWDDGSANGTGATATHTYATGGTYLITLTVTDSFGLSNSASKSVTVNELSQLASDTFSRTVASGWGTADVGGAWSSSAGLSVGSGVGEFLMSSSGQTRATYLTGFVAQDVDATVSVALDKVPNGGGTHLNLRARHTGAGDYRLKLRYLSSGAVALNLAKFVGTTETLVASGTLPGTYAAGEVLNLRLQTVSTGGSTTLNAKVWRASGAEPTSWMLTATDSQAQLQVSGQVGVSAYLTGSSTSAPLRISFDNLTVREP